MGSDGVGKGKKRRRFLLLLLPPLAVYLLQGPWAHRSGPFVPDYPWVTLTEESSDETVFLQTGLSRSAAERLSASGGLGALRQAQDDFFTPPARQCDPLLGWFTREDRREAPSGIPLADLRPGDVLVTLSTHSLGWRHGHAGLVIDGDTVLECAAWGSLSLCQSPEYWRTYTSYAVLRVKDASPALRQEVADYAKEHLCSVPYRLTAGWIGPKAPEPEDWQFGLQCAYLVWYAWARFGYNLDSDGGRLVTVSDLLRSDLVEVVQLQGMDPRGWLEEGCG